MTMSLDVTKPYCQDFTKPSVFSICFNMKDKRRARLTQLFATRFKGDRAAFMKETGYTKGRVAQFFDAKQPFGEKAGLELARRLSLADDYFESGDDVSAAAESNPDSLYKSGVSSNEIYAREPSPPPPDFADRRIVSDSGWDVLQDLADMPSTESAALRAEIHQRAESYRTFMRETLDRLRAPGDARAQTAGAGLATSKPAAPDRTKAKK